MPRNTPRSSGRQRRLDAPDANTTVATKVQLGAYAAVAGILAVGAGAGIAAAARDQGRGLALAAQVLTTVVVALTMGYLSDPVIHRLLRHQRGH